MEPPLVDWGRVDTVLLDMDGTVLDLRFDNHFWREHVPATYAARHGIDVDAARQALFPRMEALHGTLDWYCVEFWSRELGLDVVAMKRDIRHLVRVREGALEFLEAVRRSGRRLLLVTNAHERTLEIKLEQTGIGAYFDALVSAHAFDAPKEDPVFWRRFQDRVPFTPARSLFIDDTAAVLRAARRHGVGQVLAVNLPDSGAPPTRHPDLPGLDAFEELMPVPGFAA
jgi:HAD superfamily hydrolase (TIGR01509 family)